MVPSFVFPTMRATWPAHLIFQIALVNGTNDADLLILRFLQSTDTLWLIGPNTINKPINEGYIGVKIPTAPVRI